MTENKQIQFGQYYTRQEISERWGGSRYGAIEPSLTSDSVLLFSNPLKSGGIGSLGTLNVFDEKGPLINFVGHGSGDQQLVGRNKSVLQHREQRRALRLFEAARLWRGIWCHKYLGEYELDSAKPYFTLCATNDSGEVRTVIVFQLRPIGQAWSQTAGGRPDSADDQAVEAEPRDVEDRVVEFERLLNEQGLMSSSRHFLESLGHRVERFKVTVDEVSGLSTWANIDRTDGILYEVVGSFEYGALWAAVGRLLDLRRHVRPAPRRVALLLPGKPNEDQRAFIESLGVSVVHPVSGFIGWPLR